jgi:hypothetical protein
MSEVVTQLLTETAVLPGTDLLRYFDYVEELGLLGGK